MLGRSRLGRVFGVDLFLKFLDLLLLLGDCLRGRVNFGIAAGSLEQGLHLLRVSGKGLGSLLGESRARPEEREKDYCAPRHWYIITGLANGVPKAIENSE